MNQRKIVKADSPERAPGSAAAAGTVARVIMMLRVLAESEKDCGVAEVAERLDLPSSTTHRLLNLLVDQGMVERATESRSYRAGLEFVRLGGLVSSRYGATQVADKFMRAVVEECDETCMLSLYTESTRSAMIAKVIYGSHPLRYEAQLFHPSALAWGATGRGILAFLPPRVVDDVLAMDEASPGTGKRAQKVATVKRELAEIAAQGYAFTQGQKIPGAVGLSCPIFDAKGVVAALCVTVPQSRFSERMRPRIVRVVMEQARRFSAALGHRAATLRE